MVADTTFGVLGPLEVHGAEHRPTSLPPAVRVLVARLALSPGRVVPADSLIDALWGDELPADAANALQLRISKLRRALKAAGVPQDVVLTRAPGYQLAVPPDAVDAVRFEHLVGHARASTARGDSSAALARYDEALALWRGTPLADVGDAEWVRAAATRLAELRTGAEEDRLELLTDMGRHSEAIAELDSLVVEHPLRERLHRLLMLSLYRGGRQADALAVYQALRHRLADELGIDPSPDLQALAEAILRQQVSPGTAAPSPVPATPQGAAVAGVEALPARLNSFIGRGGDVDTVLARLREDRAVTLTGPGGVGKTTLALEVARRIDSTIAEAVHLIRLAAVEPGVDLREVCAAQLGVAGAVGAAAGDAVTEQLRDRTALLVVDNCEHLVDDVAALVEELLRRTPRLRVLATSREALAITGEVQVAVGPLPLPDEGADRADIDTSAAVQLFVQRARAVRPEFTLDDDTAPVVADLCRRLDGMPLAIELAAARIKVFSPAQLLARLADRFVLLTGGPRTSDARHRTLRAALDWSHDLLSPQEQTLLRRLAVFRGGWTLESAERVCSVEALPTADVAGLLFRLVDRCLVVPDPGSGRFRMLVTIQQYAHERLRDAGELGLLQEAHLRHFTELAEHHGPGVRFGRAAWKALTDDHDNLRAAVEYTLTHHDPEPGLRLCNALVQFWNYGLRYEGSRALTELLDKDGGSPAARARALQAIGVLHVYYPTPRSRAAAAQALDMFEDLGDGRAAAESRLMIALESQYGTDTRQARADTQRSRAELGDADRGWWRGMTHYVEALLDLQEEHFTSSADNWRRSAEQLEAAGDTMLSCAARAHLGIALRADGQLTDALTQLRAAVTDSRALGSLHGLAFSLVHLAHAELDAGRPEVVPALIAEADDAARRARNPRCPAWAAWARARLALERGDADTATQQCRRAVTLLEHREFRWARRQLWHDLATAAQAAGLPDDAARALAAAAAVVS